jgi:hypothetical protein
MADRTLTVVYRASLGATGKRYIIGEASSIATDDTVTFGEFTAVTDAAAFRLDNGAELTTTEATNVVTITTAAVTGLKIMVAATGY